MPGRFVEFSRDFYADPTPCERAGGMHRRIDLAAAVEAAYAGDEHGGKPTPATQAVHAEIRGAIP